MPSRIRLVAVDIDGTLLPSSGTEISRRNRDALCRAQAAGIHIVIATGRRHQFATGVVAPTGLAAESILISSNGAVVRRFDGAPMARNLLSPATARTLCGALRPFGQTMVFTFDRTDGPALVVENLLSLHSRIARWVEANRHDMIELQPLEHAFDAGEGPIQGMLCGTIPQVRAAAESLATMEADGLVATHRTEYPERSLGILDLLPPGCSKGAALAACARSLGIAPADVMAIGDNFNDQDMLEYAGHAVVMGNASAEMRSLAGRRGWTIGRSNDHDGVALALEPLIAATADASTGDSALTRKW